MHIGQFLRESMESVQMKPAELGKALRLKNGPQSVNQVFARASTSTATVERYLQAMGLTLEISAKPNDPRKL